MTEAKRLEVEGVTAAEAGDMDIALDRFSQAIRVAPHWPSAYNNRAQALRLKGDIKGWWSFCGCFSLKIAGQHLHNF